MYVLNSHPAYRQPLDPQDAALFGTSSCIDAERFFAGQPGHCPTPLHALPTMAHEMGIGSIHVKDESERLGLNSFKALGGMYAVARLVLEQAGQILGRTLDFQELDTPPVRLIAATIVVACATEGNHGRSVAAGARLTGATARIFVPAGVSSERRAAIARLGAVIVPVAGTYDDAVAEAARACAEHGWHVVSDTSWPGYERIPGHVMQGYTLLMKEALVQLPRAPTHVFIQAGVGGLAAAMAAYLMLRFGAERPRFIVVEPARAACFLSSMHAGRAIRIPHGESTVMAMLECYAPSPVAWRVLTRAADAFMRIDEDDAIAMMRRLALPRGRDPALVSGESGGAGLAGVVRALGDAHLCEALGLSSHSRVLVINTEGATDPELFEALVGIAPAAVRRIDVTSTTESEKQ